MIYSPREDSFLLQKYVKKYARGSVLDIGTGSGIQALTAARKKAVKTVLAVDIGSEAINYCKSNCCHQKISFKVSDLFSGVQGLFDTIIFNPPYLPAEPKLGDLTIEGGKKGFELAQKFLEKAAEHLKTDGIILLLISSLTNRQYIEDAIHQNLLDFKVLEIKHIFFEDLVVYKIVKSKLLNELIKRGISAVRYFSHGKRGMVYTAAYKNIKIAIKTKHPKSAAIKRMENEAKWLKIVNKRGIGPEILLAGKNYLAYKFVEGRFILDIIPKLAKNQIKTLIKNVFMQCRKLDNLKIAKEEMSHPQKHIVISKNLKAVLLDFERTHIVSKPHNVTQFCQFTSSGYLGELLKKRGFNINKTAIIKRARAYKSSPSEETFKRLIAEIK